MRTLRVLLNGFLTSESREDCFLGPLKKRWDASMFKMIITSSIRGRGTRFPDGSESQHGYDI